MKKLSSITTIILSVCFFNSCSLITTPVKVAGKVATTTIGVAGDVAGAGINAVTPRKSEEE